MYLVKRRGLLLGRGRGLELSCDGLDLSHHRVVDSGRLRLWGLLKGLEDLLKLQEQNTGQPLTKHHHCIKDISLKILNG